MLICYHRSSSLGTFSFCPQKYFLTYNLGFKDKQNKKAVMGTIVHKCMETLGNITVAKKGGKRKIKDEMFNHTFKELEDLDMISKTCFDYYVKHTPELSFTAAEYKKCHEWFLKALAFQDGKLNPLNQDIDAVEQFFDITIDKPWAKYKYEVDGEVIEGNLSIKGTIDVIARESDGYYQILDYKTGKRINWATGAIKEQKDLEKDTQLLLYYYALKNMFPDREYYVSIYYINDSKIDGVDVKGGLFDICFDESDYIKAEGILRAKFEEIRDTKQPKLLSQENTHWKCKYLCKFSEQYKDMDKTVCQHIRDEVKDKGINQVVAEYGKGLTHISSYGSGGGVLSEEDKASDST
jgi:ATP-dependent helicase/DNAse subunit B